MSISKKRYLLNKDYKEFIAPLKKAKKKESIFYTYIKLCKEIRYKDSNKKYFKTIKEGSGKSKKVINKTISKKEYESAKKNRIGNIIKRDRYKVKVDGENFYIKQYKNDLKKISILEKKFNKYKTNNSYKLPQKLSKYTLSDISTNKRYLDKNLALLGDPKDIEYELYSLYKKIERGEKDIDECLFKEMSVEDGIRVILYKIYHELKDDANRLLEKQNIKTLKDFTLQLNRSKVILKDFKYLFKESPYKNLYEHISTLYRYIDLKYTNIIQNDIERIDELFDEKESIDFIKDVDLKVENNKIKIIKFLKSREFKILLEQYRIILQDPELINKGVFDNSSLYQTSQKAIKKRLNKLSYLIKKYESCTDIDAYKKLRKSTNKLLIVLEAFLPIYKSDRYLKTIKHLKRAKVDIDKIVEMDEDYSLIKRYIKSKSKTLQDQSKKIKKLSESKQNSEKVLINKIAKILKKFKKVTFTF